MLTDQLTVYIAGPMTGYTEFNFPAFDEARDFLTQLGWEPVSPADLDRAEGFDPERAEPLTVADYQAAMQRDLTALLQCDAIVLLPGWTGSTGARREYKVARWTGKRIFQLIDGHLTERLYG